LISTARSLYARLLARRKLNRLKMTALVVTPLPVMRRMRMAARRRMLMAGALRRAMMIRMMMTALVELPWCWVVGLMLLQWMMWLVTMHQMVMPRVRSLMVAVLVKLRKVIHLHLAS